MQLALDLNNVDSYRQFLAIKRLPVYRFQGRMAWFPDEYAALVGGAMPAQTEDDYDPSPFLFDYQRDIAKLAIKKRKFCVFADCGVGKTCIFFEYARHVVKTTGKGALLLTPSMVVPQMVAEYQRFYGDALVDQLASRDVQDWLKECNGRIGITNWEAMRNDLDRGQLGALLADESSLLKDAYGEYARAVIELGRGLNWKLCGTGTPAPNDRIEYANHAVFMDRFPTVNAFLAKYFINRGQTQERWVLKPHALRPFYEQIGDWSIFLSDPTVYGWKDNAGKIPEINVTIHEVDTTVEQAKAVQGLTGGLFLTQAGGITKRAKINRIAKGLNGEKTLKYQFIRQLVDSWPEESTIIWCWYNDEQAQLEKLFPEAASIEGSTKYERRLELIEDFKAGRRKVLISKPKVLGYGLNLQVATRQIFSSLIDSFESYYQAVKRSNRIGSTKPLNVHIPITDIEAPMVENVLRKAHMVQRDTMEQQQIFRQLTQGVLNV